jgi:hypothetical protein
MFHGKSRKALWGPFHARCGKLPGAFAHYDEANIWYALVVTMICSAAFLLRQPTCWGIPTRLAVRIMPPNWSAGFHKEQSLKSVL